MLSTGLLRGGVGRIGVGERSSRRSSAGRDGGAALLALRIAPSLAAAVAEDASCLLSGDLEAASWAAICSGPGAGDNDDGDGDARPLTRDSLVDGEREFVVSLPILSRTEPTSGPRSESILERLDSAWRFQLLATAAAAAAEGGLFTVDDGRDCWKAMEAPCSAEAFREAGEANRGFAAISPFMEASSAKDESLKTKSRHGCDGR